MNTGEVVALMLSEVYDALIEAGASEAKARSAAEAVASYDNRRLDLIQHTLERSVMESRVIRGILVTISLGILWRVW